MAADIHDIWTYWEGPRPSVIQLCLKSIARQSPGMLRVVTPETLTEMGGGELLEATEGLLVQLRSDLVRAWLLYQYGGVWIDADTVCTAPLDFLHLLDQYEFIGTWNPFLRKGWGASGVQATPWASRPEGRVAARVLDHVRTLIDLRNAQGRKIQYGATSVGALSKAWKSVRAEGPPEGWGLRLQHWRYNRVPWYDARRAFQRVRPRAQHESRGPWVPHAVLHHLTNVPVAQFKESSEEELLTGRSYLSFILQKAFGLRPAVPGRAYEVCSRFDHLARLQGAEVGVMRGDLARQLLQQLPNLTLHLVDPWAPTHDPTYRETKDYQAFFGPERWENLYKHAMHRTHWHAARRVVHRMLSAEAANKIQDSSLDFVFIDADHSYEGCSKDIRLWWPKIRSGGWLCGHDYNSRREAAGLYGVQRAVDQFVSQRSLPLQRGVDLTWFVRKPA